MYTIGELAQLSGVSTRTLRYYDEIELLPATAIKNGQRVYDQAAIDRLQRILFYRELKMPLKEIAALMEANPSYIQEQLAKQHDALTLEKQRLDKVLKSLEKTMQYYQGGVEMSNDEKFSAFKEAFVLENEQRYGAEIRETYGDQAIDASNAQMMGMTENIYQEFRALEADIKGPLLLSAVQTQNVRSNEARILVEKHHEWLAYTWPSYTSEAHKGLAEMYIADERFASYYNDAVSGGAQFLHDAIQEWAE